MGLFQSHSSVLGAQLPWTDFLGFSLKGGVDPKREPRPTCLGLAYVAHIRSGLNGINVPYTCDTWMDQCTMRVVVSVKLPYMECLDKDFVRPGWSRTDKERSDRVISSDKPCAPPHQIVSRIMTQNDHPDCINMLFSIFCTCTLAIPCLPGPLFNRLTPFCGV